MDDVLLILEHMNISACDRVDSDYVGDWPHANKESRERLTEKIRAAIAEWIKETDNEPTFYAVRRRKDQTTRGPIVTIYNHTFTPFRIADGRCVVAPEAEWQAAATFTGRVLVDADLFQEWSGPLSDSDGDQLWEHSLFESTALTLSDVTHRVFSLIDASPRTTWIVRTERPENVGKCLSAISEQIDTYDAESYSKAFGSRVWLGVTARTQAELDERLPKLLSIQAAKRFVDVVPGEAIDLSSRVPGGITPFDGWVPALHWVTVRGDADPVHPDWARSLRDQATSAGVPFAFTGWGEWAHTEQSKDGLSVMTGDEWRTWLIDDDIKNWPDGTSSYCVGDKYSGRQLDGREWSEVPA